MAAPAKFLFNADFAPNSGAERPLTPAELDAKFAEVEANGFRKGAAAAEAEASAEARRRSTAALESIGAATSGRTRDEALKNINEVVHMIIEEFLDEGRALPEGPADDVDVAEVSQEAPRIAVTV